MLARRISVTHGDVFPFGCFIVSEVMPVIDWDRSNKDARVQKVDAEVGLPVWQVEVLDADPEAQKRSRTVTVKLAAKHQPVPPAPNGLPFTQVEFDGLSALPWIDDSGQGRPRIAWSFTAQEMRAPKGQTTPTKTA